jgi:hypothetical protein
MSPPTLVNSTIKSFFLLFFSHTSIYVKSSWNHSYVTKHQINYFLYLKVIFPANLDFELIPILNLFVKKMKTSSEQYVAINLINFLNDTRNCALT